MGPLLAHDGMGAISTLESPLHLIRVGGHTIWFPNRVVRAPAGSDTIFVDLPCEFKAGHYEVVVSMVFILWPPFPENVRRGVCTLAALPLWSAKMIDVAGSFACSPLGEACYSEVCKRLVE